MTPFEDFSISNNFSKGSLHEDDTFTDAAMAEEFLFPDRPISDESIESGTKILETYQVNSEAIPGGMGEVWKVHHDAWNVDLAMKRPLPHFFSEAGPAKKRAFIKECENWIMLGLHPNIVSCYYVRMVSGVPSIFSEWMSLGSLKDCIKGGLLYQGEEQVIQERILDIAIQSAWGLSYSHENELIHQDVKPGNILLTDTWDTKVADFGLAQAVVAAGISMDSDPAGNSNQGSERRSLGYSLYYCPKEQAEDKEVQPWMDIYSWAVTVLEMYTRGRQWETGAQVKDDFDQILTKIPGPIPVGMSALLEKCIRSAGDLSFSDVIQELERIYSQTIQHPYPRPRPRAAADSADSLNNYALSYYDLGRKEKALDLLQRAYEKDSRCLPAAYNEALLGYRQGLLDDLAAVAQVKSFISPGLEDAQAALALANIQAECRDSALTDTLDKMEQSFPDENEQDRLSLRDEASKNSIEEIYHYKNPRTGLVEISPDASLLAVHHADMQKTESVQFLRTADLEECSSVTRFPDAFEPSEAKIRISRDHQFCFGTYQKDPYVYRWKIADGKQTNAMVMRKLPGEMITAYDIDGTGTNVFLASNLGRLVFTNNENNQSKMLDPVSGHFTLAMSSDGTCGLVSLYEEDKVLLYSFTEEGSLEIPVKKPAYSAFVLGDEAVLTISEDVPPKLCLHDAVTGESRFEVPFPRYSEFTGRQRQVSVSCDGSRVLFGMDRGFLLFSIRDHRWLFTLSEKDTDIQRNLIVKGRLAGDENTVYLSTFTNELKGFRLPAFQESAPFLLSRIRSARKNLEEEDQFNRMGANAQTALEASDIKTALHYMKEAGEVGEGKFKTDSRYRDLVRIISPYCSILELRPPYAIDKQSVFHDPVASMSVSPDGKWLCALSEAGEMAVLDAVTCNVIYRDRVRRHAHMRKVQWAGSTFYSIVIGQNRSAFSKEGDERLKLDTGDSSGGSLGISFHGLDLVGSPGGQVYAFNMEQMPSFDQLEPFLKEQEITDVLAAEKGTVFICRRNQGEIFRYTPGKGTDHLFFTGGDYQITGSAISPDGTLALQTLCDMLNLKKEESTSSLALMYDIRTGKIRLTSTQTGITSACTFTDDGKYAIIGNDIFSVSNRSRKHLAYSNSCFVHILENSYLTALGEDHLLKVYDLRTDNLLLEAAVDENPSSLACSPDRNTLYVGNAKGEIAIWSWDHIYQPQEQGVKQLPEYSISESLESEQQLDQEEKQRIDQPQEPEKTAPSKAEDETADKPKPSFWKRMFGRF